MSIFTVLLLEALAELDRINQLVRQMKYENFPKLFNKINIHMYQCLIEICPNFVIVSNERGVQYLEFIFQEESLFKIYFESLFYEPIRWQQCESYPYLYYQIDPNSIENEDRIIEIHLNISDINQIRLPIYDRDIGIPQTVLQPSRYAFLCGRNPRTIEICQYYVIGNTKHTLNNISSYFSQFIETNHLKFEQYMPPDSMRSDLDPVFLHRLNHIFGLIQLIVEYVNRTFNISVKCPYITNLDD